MATTFKQLLSSDKSTTKTLLRESIPITGSLVSGSYGTTFPSLNTKGDETSIKNYPHGIFSSIYDYPFLSSSANKICDITVGFASDSALSRSAPANDSQQAKKINIYNSMALQLMGTDTTGSINLFDRDGNLTGGTKLRECYFINFSRLLYKDEIQKGSFTMKLHSNESYASSSAATLTITDAGAQNNYFVNSPAGEYGILSASAGEGTGTPSGQVGLLFYQAGIAVLTASIFNGAPTGSLSEDANMITGSTQASRLNIINLLTGSEISGACDAFRHRWNDITFNNTIELNSSIYYIRLNHNEFNYSSNPTYLSSSKIVVKQNSTDQPAAYVTTIGLYSSDNALLAVAKVSEPLKKTPDTELLLKLRTDW